MNREGILGHVAVGIQIALEMPAAGQMVHQLEAGDLDETMARGRIEARGLSIEDDLTHGNSLVCALLNRLSAARVRRQEN